ncbi:MAG: hypothetical protein KJ548_04065, partial [Actinobacteria bacterium]|nr:hypothetical protein [Actinomycetota bacterium]
GAPERGSASSAPEAAVAAMSLTSVLVRPVDDVLIGLRPVGLVLLALGLVGLDRLLRGGAALDGGHRLEYILELGLGARGGLRLLRHVQPAF